MTLLVLDPGKDQLPPYLEWLDCPRDAILYTGRSPGEIQDSQVRGFAAVRTFARYASSGQVELAAVGLARDTKVRAIVAVAPEDSIRAGALREYLGVAGPGRIEAIVQRDLIALRARLHDADIPALRCGAVQRVCDVYWYGHHWGYPLSVRHRRRSGWPSAARLNSDADVAAFTRGGLADTLESMPSLLIEPTGDWRERITLLCRAVGPWLPSASPAAARSLAGAALARLTRPGEGTWRVRLARQDARHEWRVDTIERAPGGEAALARAQAGLGGRRRPHEEHR